MSPRRPYAPRALRAALTLLLSVNTACGDEPSTTGDVPDATPPDTGTAPSETPTCPTAEIEFYTWYGLGSSCEALDEVFDAFHQYGEASASLTATDVDVDAEGGVYIAYNRLDEQTGAASGALVVFDADDARTIGPLPFEGGADVAQLGGISVSPFADLAFVSGQVRDGFRQGGESGGRSDGAGLYALVRMEGSGAVVSGRSEPSRPFDESVDVGIDGDGYVYFAYNTDASSDASSSRTFGIRRLNIGGVPPTLYDDGELIAFSSSDTEVSRILVRPDGGLFVVGHTYGDIGGALPPADAPPRAELDVFVAAYDNSGTQLGAKRYPGPGMQYARGIARAEDGTLHVVGTTEGLFARESSRGGVDAFHLTLDAEGTEISRVQFGTGARDEAHGIAIDSEGTIVIVGTTWAGRLRGVDRLDADVLLRVVDVSGRVRVARFGTTDEDAGRAVAALPGGGFVLTGSTRGLLSGQISASPEASDVFVVRYVP